MKLLISCDDYCYYYKGQYYLREFGRILFNRYLNVADSIRVAVRVKEVQSANELGAYNLVIDDERIEIFALPFFSGPNTFIHMYFHLKNIVKYTIEGCDACIVRLPSIVAFMVMDKVIGTRLPFAVEIVANPFELSKQGGALNYIIWQFLHVKLKNICKKADCISYVSKISLEKLYHSYKNNCYVTYYSSVSLTHDNYYHVRNESHIPFVICHVSNPIVLGNKGQDAVLKISSILVNKGYNIKVKFAGEGSGVSYFKKMSQSLGISENVEFVGFLNSHQLKQLFINSDLMLFPTKSEGLPRVLIEAMATGLPCLSTPVGGIPELLDNDCLFSPFDIDGFAQKVEEIIKNGHLYEKLSENNYRKSLEYSSELLTKKRNNLYTELKKRII